MKLILISDIHLSESNPKSRLDNIVATQFQKLSYVYDYAIDNKIKYIIISGDLFDVARNFKLLIEYYDFFLHYKKHITTYVIYGQHDLYLRSKKSEATNLGVLIKVGLVDLLNNIPINIDFDVSLYGCSYGDEIPAIQENDKFNILVIHKEISDILIPNMNITLGYQFLKNSNFDFIFCGDIHKKFITYGEERIICNTGPMLRREASEEMFKHRPVFFIYNTENFQITEEIIPHKISEEILTRIFIETKNHKNTMLTKFIESVKKNNLNSSKYNLVSTKQKIVTYLNENNIKDEIRYILKGVMSEDC